MPPTIQSNPEIIQVNPEILRKETNSFLRGIDGYRSRLVMNTLHAAEDFRLGVFGFQHFISDFTKSLEPALGLGMTMTEVLRVNSLLLQEKAASVFDGDTDEDKASQEKVRALCAIQLEDMPISRTWEHGVYVKAAREALRNYYDASLTVFEGEMKKKGMEAGVGEMPHLLEPIRSLLEAPVVLHSRAARGLNR